MLLGTWLGLFGPLPDGVTGWFQKWQMSKGFQQLAGKEIEMRLGGIYALEAVMNSSEQYHQPVLEALCAFVRQKAA